MHILKKKESLFTCVIKLPCFWYGIKLHRLLEFFLQKSGRNSFCSAYGGLVSPTLRTRGTSKVESFSRFNCQEIRKKCLFWWFKKTFRKKNALMKVEEICFSDLGHMFISKQCLRRQLIFLLTCAPASVWWTKLVPVSQTLMRYRIEER